MATIIDCGAGRFIAGDPVDHLEEGQHWCNCCAGSGTVYDYSWSDELELTICTVCDGSGAIACSGAGCGPCADERRDALARRLEQLIDLVQAADERAQAAEDWRESLRQFNRWRAISAASRELVKP